MEGSEQRVRPWHINACWYWKYVFKFLWLWLSAFSRVFDKVQLCTPQTEVEFYILLNWGRIVYQQGLSAVEADCGNDPAR